MSWDMPFSKALQNHRLAVLAGVFFILGMVLQLPGNVPYDGIVVWHEAETRTLYAQHPAALVLIWRLCETAIRGPALFTAVSLAALWLAIGILLERLRPPLWAAVVFSAAILLWPPLLATSGVTVKDVLGAHLVLLSFALADGGRRSRWFAAFAAGTLAFLLRYQFGLILPLLALMAWQQHRLRMTLTGVAAVVVTIVAVNGLVSLVFVKTGPGDVMLSLRKIAIFDIAGAVAHDSSVPLTVFARRGIDTAALTRDIAARYSPVRVDTLWQTKDSGTITPDSGVFGRLHAIPDRVVLRQWREIAAARPGAVFAHRTAAFARVVGIGDIWQCRPLTTGISWLPHAAAVAVGAKDFSAPLSANLGRLMPVSLTFRAALYLAVLLAVLIVGPPPARLLAGFALAYEVSFFFLPQACEVRYAYPVVLLAVTAGAIAIQRRFI